MRQCFIFLFLLVLSEEAVAQPEPNWEYLLSRYPVSLVQALYGRKEADKAPRLLVTVVYSRYRGEKSENTTSYQYSLLERRSANVVSYSSGTCFTSVSSTAGRFQHKIIYEYDSAGNVRTIQPPSDDSVSNKVTGRRKFYYVYDSRGRIIKLLCKVLYRETGQYIDESRTFYERNSDGDVVNQTTEEWDYREMRWVKYWQSYYSRNQAHNILTFSRMRWYHYGKIDWRNSEREEYYYDVTGAKLTSYTTYKWNQNDSNWKVNYQTIVGYDSCNSLISSLVKIRMNDRNDKWDTLGCSTFYYDAEGNKIEQKHWSNQFYKGLLGDTTKIIWTYNEYNQVRSVSSGYLWRDGKWERSRDCSDYYNYYEGDELKMPEHPKD